MRFGTFNNADLFYRGWTKGSVLPSKRARHSYILMFCVKFRRQIFSALSIKNMSNDAGPVG